MLKPKVPIENFIEKFGFKKCKKPYDGCYYLCVAKDSKMIFLSEEMLKIFHWRDDDPRIHSNANCKYRDKRTAMDIMYEIIKADMVKEVI
jgi:hypothetical protein